MEIREKGADKGVSRRRVVASSRVRARAEFGDGCELRKGENAAKKGIGGGKLREARRVG